MTLNVCLFFSLGAWGPSWFSPCLPPCYSKTISRSLFCGPEHRHIWSKIMVTKTVKQCCYCLT